MRPENISSQWRPARPRLDQQCHTGQSLTKQRLDQLQSDFKAGDSFLG